MVGFTNPLQGGPHHDRYKWGCVQLPISTVVYIIPGKPIYNDILNGYNSIYN